MQKSSWKKNGQKRNFFWSGGRCSFLMKSVVAEYKKKHVKAEPVKNMAQGNGGAMRSMWLISNSQKKGENRLPPQPREVMPAAG